MRRRLEEIVSFRALERMRYLPAAVFAVKNWFQFLLNYIGVKDEGAVYYLRNGLSVKTGDGVGAAILFGIFLRKDYGPLPPPRSLVIDIGAHVGMYSLYASNSKDTKVFAYEPAPKNFSLLQENIEQNALKDRISVFHLAVSSTPGHVRLYLRPRESGLHSFLPLEKATFQTAYTKDEIAKEPFVDVPCISLKDIFDQQHIERCDMLKIDCEGAEYDILYALPKTYFQRIQNIRLEYHNYPRGEEYTGKALLSFLENHSFRIQKIMKLDHQGTAWLTR